MISSVSSFQSPRWFAVLSLLLCTLLLADVSFAAEAKSNSSPPKAKASKKQTKKNTQKEESKKASKKKATKKSVPKKSAKKTAKKVAKKPTKNAAKPKKKAAKKVAKKATKKAVKKAAKKVAKKKAKKKQPSKELVAYRKLLKKFEKVYAMQITAKTLDEQKKQWSTKKKLYDTFAGELKKLINGKDKSVAVCAYRALADASVELAEAASEAPLPKRKQKWNKKDAKQHRDGVEKSLVHFRKQGYVYYKAGLTLAKKHKINNNCSQSLAQIVAYVNKKAKKGSKK